MKIAVWDTYVYKANGTVMHLDIIAPTVICKECSFCHIESASEEMELVIKQKGYYIIEMQGCN